MKYSLAAVATTLALVLGACDENGLSKSSDNAETGSVSSVQMNLTLPDGTVINSINYSVTGSLLTAARTGVVNLANSTQLRFRVGDLPVGNGYTMAIGGTTTTGTACAGTAGFNIANNLVTTLTMSLVCGTGVVYEVDNRGDVSVTVDVRNEAGVTCPVVTGISALPLEVRVGSSLELAGYQTSTAGATSSWTGTGGTFSAATASATSFLCTSGGDQTLTYSVAKTGCTTSTQPVTVTCTGAVTPVDAGTDSGPAPVDAGQDSGPAPIDAGTDSGPGPVDAGPADAGLKLRGGADCEACFRTKCANFEGVNLADPCFLGTNFIEPVTDPAFAQKCTDTVVCSHNTTDGCSNNALGPFECYCGVGVAVDVCQANFANVKGACIPQWTAAAGCGATDQACVLGAFTDLTLPAGYANFMFQCQREACNSECAN